MMWMNKHFPHVQKTTMISTIISMLPLFAQISQHMTQITECDRLSGMKEDLDILQDKFCYCKLFQIWHATQ